MNSNYFQRNELSNNNNNSNGNINGQGESLFSYSSDSQYTLSSHRLQTQLTNPIEIYLSDKMKPALIRQGYSENRVEPGTGSNNNNGSNSNKTPGIVF